MTEALKLCAPYFLNYLVNFSRFFDALYLAGMIFLAYALRYFRVDLPALTLRFWFALRRFPQVIKNGVNVFARIHDLPRRDVAERSRAVWRLPVTADIVSACPAFPERDMRQVWTVWINFLATCQPCVHFRGASAAVNGTYGR
jgi:hypothetical protein